MLLICQFITIIFILNNHLSFKKLIKGNYILYLPIHCVSDIFYFWDLSVIWYYFPFSWRISFNISHSAYLLTIISLSFHLSWSVYFAFIFEKNSYQLYNSTLAVFCFLFFNQDLFIYLFFGRTMQHVGSSSLTRDQTCAPCTGSMES